MNLYDNSGIDCNKKNKNIIYDLYIYCIKIQYMNCTNTRQIVSCP